MKELMQLINFKLINFKLMNFKTLNNFKKCILHLFKNILKNIAFKMIEGFIIIIKLKGACVYGSHTTITMQTLRIIIRSL